MTIIKDGIWMQNMQYLVRAIRKVNTNIHLGDSVVVKIYQICSQHGHLYPKECVGDDVFTI